MAKLNVWKIHATVFLQANGLQQSIRMVWANNHTEIMFHPIHNDEGIVTGVVAFNRDITPIKRAGGRLRKSEASPTDKQNCQSGRMGN